MSGNQGIQSAKRGAELNVDGLRASMVHIERIVRPVRATERRKLRMRRELLGHLEAAIQEERAEGGSEAEVLQRARQRLGEVKELRELLQKSVPWIERMLFARMPAPSPWDRWEDRAGRRWGLATMMQGAIVSGSAAVVASMALGLATPIPPERRQAFFNMQTDAPMHYLAVVLGCAVMSLLMMLAAVWFMARIARGREKGSMALAIAIVALHGTWPILMISQVLGETIGIADIARGIATGIIVVVIFGAVGLMVARLGRPYEEWRRLELAE